MNGKSAALLEDEYLKLQNSLDTSSSQYKKMEFVSNELKNIENVRIRTLIKYALFAENIENVSISFAEFRAVRQHIDSLGLLSFFNNYHSQIQELKPIDLSEFETSTSKKVSSPELDSLRAQTQRLKELAKFIQENSFTEKK